jgi:hypothetical protein
LVEYLVEYYNMYDFEVFLIHGTSHRIGFIQELRKEYEQICSGGGAVVSPTAKKDTDEDLFQDALDY